MAEALYEGLLVMLVGTVAAATVGKLFKVDLPPVCKEWNRNYTMEISLFFTGVMVYFVRAACAGLAPQ